MSRQAKTRISTEDAAILGTVAEATATDPKYGKINPGVQVWVDLDKRVEKLMTERHYATRTECYNRILAEYFKVSIPPQVPFQKSGTARTMTPAEVQAKKTDLRGKMAEYSAVLLTIPAKERNESNPKFVLVMRRLQEFETELRGL